jgi:hypothetical protein
MKRKNDWQMTFYMVIIFILITVMLILSAGDTRAASQSNEVNIWFSPNNSGTYIQAIEWKVTGCDIRVTHSLETEVERSNADCDYFEGVDYSIVSEPDFNVENWYAESTQLDGIKRIVMVTVAGVTIHRLYLPIVVR